MGGMGTSTINLITELTRYHYNKAIMVFHTMPRKCSHGYSRLVITWEGNVSGIGIYDSSNWILFLSPIPKIFLLREESTILDIMNIF
jgi:hypothetical protein